MCIDSLSGGFENSDEIYFYANDTAAWNGKEIELLMQQESGGSRVAKSILTNFQMTSSGKAFNIAPMSGSANLSVEKDTDGNSSASADISVSGDNTSVKAEVSVDQDGNVSGKVEVGISWKE